MVYVYEWVENDRLRGFFVNREKMCGFLFLVKISQDNVEISTEKMELYTKDYNFKKSMILHIAKGIKNTIVISEDKKGGYDKTIDQLINAIVSMEGCE